MADRWTNANLGNLLPGFVPAVMTPASAAVKGISTLLSGSIALMETLKVFLVDVTDPAAALVSAIIEQVNTALADLQNTGVYFTVVPPYNLADRKGTKTAMRLIANSMFDKYDANRPQYTRGEAVGAVVLMVGGADLTNLLPGAALMELLFNLNELRAFLRLNNNIFVPDYDPFPQGGGVVTGLIGNLDPTAFFQDLSRNEKVDRFARLRLRWVTGRNTGILTHVKGFEPSTRVFQIDPMPRTMQVGDTYQIFWPQGGRPPDWANIKVIDFIPALTPILIELQSLTRLMAAAVKATQGASAFITALQNKQKQLLRAITTIETRLIELQKVVQASGVSLLPLPPQIGGTEVLAQRLLAAENPPPFKDGFHYTVSAIGVCNAVGYPILRRFF